MIKKYWKIWLFLLVLQSISTPFVRAQNTDFPTTNPPKEIPAICQTTPWSFNIYLRFQQQTIALLNADPFESITEIISLPEGGLFSNRVLTITGLQNYDDSLIGQTLRLLGTASENLIIWNTTAAALFWISAISTVGDAAMNFMILFHDRPIVRDRTKLLDIERKLSSSTYYLGKSWKITTKIKDTQQLRDLISYYQKEGLLSTENNFPAGEISYMAILTDLAHLNTQVKKYLAYGTTSSMGQTANALVSFRPRYLAFSSKRISTLKTDYQAVKGGMWFVCNRSLNESLNNLTLLRKNTSETTKSSTNTINNAVKKLTEALKLQKWKDWKNNDNLDITDAEMELLRNVYGLDTRKMTNEWKLEMLTFTQGSKAERNIAKNKMKDGRESIKKTWKGILSVLKDTKNSKTPSGNSIQTIELTTEEVEQKQAYNPILYDNLNITFERIITSEQEAKNSAEVSNNLILTSQFGTLAFQIQQLADIIGNKESGIRKYLNETCTYQCSNKPTNSCYIL